MALVSSNEILDGTDRNSSVCRAVSIIELVQEKGILTDLVGLAELLGGTPIHDVVDAEGKATRRMESLWHFFPGVKLLPIPCLVEAADHLVPPIKGALNIKPDPSDFLSRDIVDVDIRSAYPTTIRLGGVDPPRWTPDGINQEGPVPDNGLVEYVRFLLDARAKGKGNPTALKLMANVVYGWLCTHFRELGRLIVSAGRDRLQNMVSAIEQLPGAKVLCAQTDGALVSSKATPEQILEAAQAGVGEGVEVRINKHMDACLLFNANKWTWKEKGIQGARCKGTQCRQALQPDLVRSVEHHLSMALLEETDPTNRIETILTSAFESLNQLNVGALVGYSKIRSSTSQYATEYLQSHLYYPTTALPWAVALVHAYHRGLSVKSQVGPEDFTHNSWLEADNRHYHTQIYDTAARVLQHSERFMLILDLVSSQNDGQWP
jgi:hypothetical protein